MTEIVYSVTARAWKMVAPVVGLFQCLGSFHGGHVRGLKQWNSFAWNRYYFPGERKCIVFALQHGGNDVTWKCSITSYVTYEASIRSYGRLDCALLADYNQCLCVNLNVFDLRSNEPTQAKSIISYFAVTFTIRFVQKKYRTQQCTWSADGAREPISALRSADLRHRLKTRGAE